MPLFKVHVAVDDTRVIDAKDDYEAIQILWDSITLEGAYSVEVFDA